MITRLCGEQDAEGVREDTDAPPSYEDLVKSEVPPPTYSSVVPCTPRMQRLLNLPWFLKKKLLEQTVATVGVVQTLSPGKSDLSFIVVDVEGSLTNESEGEMGSIWRSRDLSGNVCNDEVQARIDLPSYEALMREAVQPVMTPIHRALSNLPRPPPYSSRPMEAITENEQQHEQQQQ